MLLSQYVYGRKPEKGLDVIARSRDLPFYQQDWLNTPRYGSPPAQETEDRIWTQRYELQTLDAGAVLSCLYPLKQTTVPCSKLRPPYPKGITPAVHHLLVAPEDVPALLADPAAAVWFDAFLPIDAIYALDGSLLEPVAFAVQTPPEAPLSDLERYLCVSLAAYVWRAFIARRDKKLALLSQKRVLLIVPRTTPAEELAKQRALLTYVLAALPPHIRRYASYTLNLDAESADLPANASLYGMSRATPGAQPTVAGTVFDLENFRYPEATDAERAYFSTRANGQASSWFDAVLAQVEQAADLPFCIRLWQVEQSLAQGDPAAVDLLDALILQDGLASHRDLLVHACLQATFATCQADPSPQNLAMLWRFLGQLSDPLAYQGLPLHQLTPPPHGLLAVLSRDDALALPKASAPQDDLFCAMAARSIAEAPVAIPEGTKALLLHFFGNANLSPARLAAWQPLTNTLFAHGLLATSELESLLTWLETRFLQQVPGLALPADADALLGTLDSPRLRALLYATATANRQAQATTPLERRLLTLFTARQLPVDWGFAECETLCERILALRDGSPEWPSHLLPALVAQSALAAYGDLCYRLMQKPWIRNLPATRNETAQLTVPYALRNLAAVLAQFATAQDTLLYTQRWQAFTDEPNPPILTGSFAAAVTERLDTLYAALSPLAVQQLAEALPNAPLPLDFQTLAQQALARRAFALLTPALAEASSQTVFSLSRLLRANAEPGRRTPPIGQAIELLDQLAAQLPTAKGDQPKWFLMLRKRFTQLPAEGRAFADTLLTRDYAQVLPALLLAALQPDDTVRWETAFPAYLNSLHLYGRTRDGRAAIPKEKVDEFLSALFHLYRPPQKPTETEWLHAADQHALAELIRAQYPDISKKLEKDHQKIHDLPDSIVAYFNLR